MTTVSTHLDGKRILLIEPLDMNSRGYIVDELRRLGVEIIAVSRNKQLIADHFPNGLWLPKEEFGLNPIVEFGLKQGVDGVLTYWEEDVVLTSHVADALDLPGTDPSKATLFRDKSAMRDYLSARGLDKTRSYKVRSYEELLSVYSKVGFPLVLKPMAGYGSNAVLKVSNFDELKSAFDKVLLFCDYQSKRASEPVVGIIVEEYLSGHEYSVELFCINNEPGEIGVTKKLLGPLPYFEEVGHVFPVPSELPDYSKAVQFGMELINEVRPGSGILHLEVRIDNDVVRLIEVGMRLGGDFIPKLVQHSGVTCPVEIAATIATGGPVHQLRPPKKCSSVVFPSTARQGVIKSIDFTHKPPSLEEKKLWWQPGDVISRGENRSMMRLGYLIQSGDYETLVASASSSYSELVDVCFHDKLAAVELSGQES